MNINFSDLTRNVEKDKNHNDLVSIFIKELEKGLEKMNSDIKEFTVDRFEQDVAVCENRQTKKMVNIKLQDLPKGIKEGSLLIYKNGEFIFDKEKEQEVEKRIKEKMDNLWNN